MARDAIRPTLAAATLLMLASSSATAEVQHDILGRTAGIRGRERTLADAMHTRWRVQLHHSGPQQSPDAGIAAQHGIVPQPAPTCDISGELSLAATGRITSIPATRSAKLRAAIHRFDDLDPVFLQVPDLVGERRLEGFAEQQVQAERRTRSSLGGR